MVFEKVDQGKKLWKTYTVVVYDITKRLVVLCMMRKFDFQCFWLSFILLSLQLI